MSSPVKRKLFEDVNLSSSFVNLFLSEEKIISKTEFFDDKLRQCYRAIPGRIWNCEKRCWMFPLKQFPSVVLAITVAGFGCRFATNLKSIHLSDKESAINSVKSLEVEKFITLKFLREGSGKVFVDFPYDPQVIAVIKSCGGLWDTSEESKVKSNCEKGIWLLEIGAICTFLQSLRSNLSSATVTSIYVEGSNVFYLLSAVEDVPWLAEELVMRVAMPDSRTSVVKRKTRPVTSTSRESSPEMNPHPLQKQRSSKTALTPPPSVQVAGGDIQKDKSPEVQESKFACKICLSNFIDHILLPCRHACCGSCASKIKRQFKKCSFCNSTIKRVDKFFVP